MQNPYTKIVFVFLSDKEDDLKMPEYDQETNSRLKVPGSWCTSHYSVFVVVGGGGGVILPLFVAEVCCPSLQVQTLFQSRKISFLYTLFQTKLQKNIRRITHNYNEANKSNGQQVCIFLIFYSEICKVINHVRNIGVKWLNQEKFLWSTDNVRKPYHFPDSQGKYMPFPNQICPKTVPSRAVYIRI